MALTLASTTDLLLAAITLYYAIVTHRILAANQKLVLLSERQSEATNRPYITGSVIAREGEKYFEFVVRNSGRSSALKLEMALSPEFFMFNKQRGVVQIPEFSAFRKPIPSFSPGAELVFDLGAAYVFFQEGEEHIPEARTFVFSAKYLGVAHTYREETVIDLSMFYFSSAAAVGLLGEAKKASGELSKMADALREITRSLDR